MKMMMMVWVGVMVTMSAMGQYWATNSSGATQAVVSVPWVEGGVGRRVVRCWRSRRWGRRRRW
jgi:hypothetical protein